MTNDLLTQTRSLDFLRDHQELAQDPAVFCIMCLGSSFQSNRSKIANISTIKRQTPELGPKFSGEAVRN